MLVLMGRVERDGHSLAGGIPEGGVEQEGVVAESPQGRHGRSASLAGAVHGCGEAGSVVENELAVFGGDGLRGDGRRRVGRHGLADQE